jgi:hypothetical protein
MARRPALFLLAVFCAVPAVSAQVARGVAPPVGTTFTRDAQPSAPPQRPVAALQPQPLRDPASPGHAIPRGPVAGDDLFLARPWTYAPRYDRTSRPRPYATHGWDGYLPAIYVPAWSDERYPDAPPEDSGGFLRLDVEPADAQVFVDAYYVGTVEEFRRARPLLPSGPHHIEVRAEGFETLTVDVRIRTGQTITYSASLRATPSVATPPQPAVQPGSVAVARTETTIYVIPRCYAGNARPTASQLPAGCDITDLRIVRSR